MFDHINASPDGTKRINYNRLTGVPLYLEADLIRTSQLALKARDVYPETHPEERNNPMLQVRLGEDGFVKYGSKLQQQSAIASPGVQQANPNQPLVTFIDQPDGTFDAKLVTGETFRGFRAQENRDAIRKLAESKVNTRRHYESLAQQQQPTNGQHSDPGLTANQPFDSQAYLRGNGESFWLQGRGRNDLRLRIYAGASREIQDPGALL